MHLRKRTDVSTIDWPDKSRKTYKYWFLDLDRPVKDEDGNYMFVKQLANGSYLPLHIGQADRLKNRIPNHDRLDDAKRAGATHVTAHTTPAGERSRLDEERDLIQHRNPSLNVQHCNVS